MLVCICLYIRPFTTTSIATFCEWEWNVGCWFLFALAVLPQRLLWRIHTECCNGVSSQQNKNQPAKLWKWLQLLKPEPHLRHSLCLILADSNHLKTNINTISLSNFCCVGFFFNVFLHDHRADIQTATERLRQFQMNGGPQHSFEETIHRVSLIPFHQVYFPKEIQEYIDSSVLSPLFVIKFCPLFLFVLVKKKLFIIQPKS